MFTVFEAYEYQRQMEEGEGELFLCALVDGA